MADVPVGRGPFSTVEHKHVAVDGGLMALNAGSKVAARLLNVTIIIWSFQYLLERIPPAELSVYPVIMALVVIPPFFFSFLTGGLNRNAVEAYARSDFEQVTRITSSIFPFVFALALTFVLLGTLFAFHVESFLNVAPGMVAEARWMTVLLAISFSLQSLALPFTAGYLIKQRFVELSLLELGKAVLKLAVLYALLVGVAPSVVFVVVAAVVSDLAFTLATTIRSRAFVPELTLRMALFDRSTALGLATFGFWTTVGRAAMIFYSTAGTVILNLVGSPVDVINYFLGITLFQQLQNILLVARQPMQPALIAMHALDDQERLADAVCRTGRYELWLALLPVGALALFAHDIVRIVFSSDYDGAGPVIILFMATFPFAQPTGIMYTLAIARGKVRDINLAVLACSTIGLLIAYIFHQTIGLDAVTMAACLVITIIVPQLVYFWPEHLRLSGVAPRTFLIDVVAYGLTPAAVSMGAMIYMKSFLHEPGIVGVGTVVTVGGVLYCMVMAALARRTGDWEIVAAQLARIRRMSRGAASRRATVAQKQALSVRSGA